MYSIIDRDVNGNQVDVGDVLVHDGGDTAWFYRIEEDGTLRVFANWSIGSLALMDLTQRLQGEDMNAEVNSYFKSIMEKNVWELEKASEAMMFFINQLTPEHWHMPLTGGLEDPHEPDEDDEI